MKTKILLNPYSNRWNSQKRWPAAEVALRAAGVEFDLSISQHTDHLVELAAAAIKDGFTTLIVAGGDGSIGEVVNGAARGWDEKSPFPITMGILPLGTANDLAAVCQHQAGKNKMDLWDAALSGGSGAGDHGTPQLECQHAMGWGLV
jgi:diacylglycerol kinase family enzyme